MFGSRRIRPVARDSGWGYIGIWREEVTMSDGADFVVVPIDIPVEKSASSFLAKHVGEGESSGENPGESAGEGAQNHTGGPLAVVSGT